MTVDAAIEKLNKLKKLSRIGLGRCEITNMSEDKIEFSLSLDTSDSKEQAHVIGFHP